MFEYENDLLIVDELIYDPGLPNSQVIRINDNYYMINNAERSKPIKEAALRPYKKQVNKKWMRMEQDYQYLFAGMIPRCGFKVNLGRPITADELKELCERFNLTEEDISNEFEDQRGAIFGTYAKTLKSVQVKVPTDKAISLESELREKGIEAGNGSAGRVDIRTDWGGYREGAGRKPTGRRLARIYVTEEEEQKLREYLDGLRNE